MKAGRRQASPATRSLRQCRNGWERYPGAASSRATPGSGRLLFWRPVHGLHCRIPVEAGNLLWIRLQTLSLSRYAQRQKCVRL